MRRLIAAVFGQVFRLIRGIGRGIVVFVALVWFAIFVGVIGGIMQGAAPEPLPERAALLLNPEGVLVEDTKPLPPFEALMGSPEGQEILLADIISVIDSAAQDDRIPLIVLDLQGLQGPTSSQALELARAIERFQATGKRVVAIGDYYDQNQYLLAAHADRVLLHPMGGINLLGYGVYQTYIRDLLENIKVTMHVFRVGENKSFVEPYLRNDMSETEREVVGQWVGGLWTRYVEAVEDVRGLPQGTLDTLINQLPEKLAEAEGDIARVMLDAGLVDELVDNGQMDRQIAAWIDAEDDAEEGYPRVQWEHYAAVQAFQPKLNGRDPLIAVVPVSGSMVPGESDQGLAGSTTVAEQIHEALDADNLAAVVLRVDSGGGSVFAADVMARALEEVRAAGIPVIASFGSVAASGGYYIAAQADQIWAHPNTITGSIGVFAAFPTVERVYEHFGLHVDGVGTTELAGAFRLDRPLNPNVTAIMNASVQKIYRDFVQRVATGRGMSWEAVDAVAGGKVWNGQDAQAVGLVDELGGLEEAIAAAAQAAGVTQWRVERFGTPLSPEQQLIAQLSQNFGATLGVHMPVAVQRWLAPLTRELDALLALQDPANVYVSCLECRNAAL
jgi:protease-4